MATIKGCTKVGLNLLVFTVHPMKAGATLLNSFLFNVALVLLATTAAIQFCVQNFALYASGTAIQEIWGYQVRRRLEHCRLWDMWKLPVYERMLSSRGNRITHKEGWSVQCPKKRNCLDICA